jgi:hypothetical protein
VRAALGPALAHLAILAAGLGTLWLAGVLRDLTLRRLLAAAGLAYMAGVAVVTTVLIALVVMGVPLSLGLFAGICVALAVPLGFGLRRREAWTGLHPRGLRELDLEGRVAAGVVVALLLLAIAGLLAAGLRPLTEFDAWQLWTRKAVLLFYDAHLPVEVFTGEAYPNVQPDYPLSLPMLEALQFRAGGRPDTAEAHATTWILLVATIWGACYLGARVARPLVWAGVAAGLAVLLSAEALTAQADVPVAGFLGLGTLAMGLWLSGGRRSDLALAAILLGGAASTKNEGLIGAVIVFVVAGGVHAVERRWRTVGSAALAGLAMLVVAVLPWRIWMAAHDVTGTLPLSKGLNPSYLVERFDRVWPSVQAVASQLTGAPAAQVVVPIGIAIGLVALRSVPRLAAFYLAVGVLYCAGLVWAYWISPLDLQFHIFTSVSRVVLPAALIALAAILHLGGRPDRSASSERATLDP